MPALLLLLILLWYPSPQSSEFFTPEEVEYYQNHTQIACMPMSYGFVDKEVETIYLDDDSILTFTMATSTSSFYIWVENERLHEVMGKEGGLLEECKNYIQSQYEEELWFTN